jgi:hypothetical protein
MGSTINLDQRFVSDGECNGLSISSYELIDRSRGIRQSRLNSATRAQAFAKSKFELPNPACPPIVVLRRAVRANVSRNARKKRPHGEAAFDRKLTHFREIARDSNSRPSPRVSFRVSRNLRVDGN